MKTDNDVICADWNGLNYSVFHPRLTTPRATLVFVHTVGATQNVWMPLVPGLLDKGFKCVLFDLPGAGRSAMTRIKPSVASLANIVINLMDILGIDEAVLVAHSFAVNVAGHLVAYFPFRFICTVWMAPRLQNHENVRQIMQWRILNVENTGSLAQMATVMPLVSVGCQASTVVRAFVREMLLAQDPVGFIHHCKHYEFADPVPYHNTTVPILVMGGEEDIAVFKWLPEEICDNIRTARRQPMLFDGVGHWLCIEAPEAVTKGILSFFNIAVPEINMQGLLTNNNGQ